ncbi:MAG: hypothetical protein ACK4RT_05750 [Erythrobacter sp.]
MADDPKITDTPENGRRKGERRQRQQPFDGPDRRKGDRRTGGDRRAKPRS